MHCKSKRKNYNKYLNDGEVAEKQKQGFKDQ